jgi:hypothetical protein
MTYHNHSVRGFTVDTIPLSTVEVDRRSDGIYLGGKLLQRVHVMPDGCIKLEAFDRGDEADGWGLTVYVHGHIFWRILHDEEEPNAEYAGVLEAQLTSIRAITRFYETWPGMPNV